MSLGLTLVSDLVLFIDLKNLTILLGIRFRNFLTKTLTQWPYLGFLLAIFSYLEAI